MRAAGGGTVFSPHGAAHLTCGVDAGRVQPAHPWSPQEQHVQHMKDAGDKKSPHTQSLWRQGRKRVPVKPLEGVLWHQMRPAWHFPSVPFFDTGSQASVFAMDLQSYLLAVNAHTRSDPKTAAGCACCVLCPLTAACEASETGSPCLGGQEHSHGPRYEIWQLESNPKHDQFPCIDGALPFFPGLVYKEERGCFVSLLGNVFSYNVLLFHNV